MMIRTIFTLALGLLAASPLVAQQNWLSEDFDTFPPAGWSLQSNGAAGRWEDGSLYSWRLLIIDDMAYHTNLAGGQNDDRLVPPSIDLSAASGPLFLHWFDYKNRMNYQAHHSNSIGDGSSTVEVSVDGGSSWSTVWTETRESGAADSPHVDLTGYAGTADLKIAFRYQGNDAHEWGIDEVRLDSSPYGSVRSLVNPANGHTYIQCYKGTWNEALAIAGSFGGYPVAINDAAENQWIWQNFSKWSSTVSTSDEFIQRSIWTGGTDAASEGNWSWISGEAMTYTNWSSGEPNNDTANDPNGEDFLRMDSGDGRWLDKHEAASLFVLVEVSGPLYIMSNLVAGQTAALSLSNATANGRVVFAYSLTGAGPTNTPYGPVAMSLPINQLPIATADATGYALTLANVPAGAAGITVYSQALDLSAGVLSNALVETVQ